MLRIAKYKILRSPESGEGGTQNTEVASSATANTSLGYGAEGGGGADVLPNLPAEGKVPVTKEGEGVNTEGNDISLDEPIGDLEDLENDNLTTPDKVKKKEEEVKKNEEELVTKETVDDKTKEAKKQEDSSSQQKARDYSQFSKEDAAIARQMPNAAFNRFKEIVTKHKELEVELGKLKTEVIPNLEKGIVKMPESYAEHPEAYVLTPEYGQYKQAYYDVGEEAQHWLTQLQAIEKGEAWKDIVGRDEKTGELVLSEPIESQGDDVVAHKVAIQQALTKAKQHQSHFLGQLKGLKENHTKGWKQACDDVGEHCKKHFPWITDSKLMETPVEVEIGKPKVPLKAALKSAIDLIQPQFRAHPMSQVFGHMVVANLIASQKIRAYEAELNVVKQNKQDSLSTEPGSGSKGSGAKKKEDSGDIIGSLNDMDE